MANNTNLEVYNAVRNVPQEAKKTIGAGRLKGMTDINPMWRIKTLTEQFGPCGFGWYYDIADRWVDLPENSQEVTANIQINLFVKFNGEWSKPIQGIGGSKLAASERNGLYISDECWKMALTDAISVACKALGVGADVYWDKDRTKYDNSQNNNPQPEGNQNKSSQNKQPATTEQTAKDPKVKLLEDELKRTGTGAASMLQFYNMNSLEELANSEKFKEATDKLKARPDKK